MVSWPTFSSARPFGVPGLPNVGSALVSLSQPIKLQKIIKTTVGFQVVEETVEYSSMGVLQPFTDIQLSLLPEGQRVWENVWLHILPAVKLQVDDRIVINSKGYRVMAFKDYSDYGYMEFHLLQDYSGSDPKVVTP